ncbi:MAG: helix-turn-helix domain-containing protein [Saprospiraceae bacterium]|nr:helix-turn-helix domain-containing protein [Saprospiraceae bacterium]
MEHNILHPDFPEIPVQLIQWEQPDPWDIPLHSHEFDEILFFQKGGGVHMIGKKQFTLSDHQVHFIPRGIKHVLNREAQSSGFTLAFDRSFLEQHLQLFLQALPFYRKPVQFSYSIRASAFDRFLKYKNSIIDEISNSTNYFAQPLFLNYVSALLLELSKEIISQSEILDFHPRHKEIIKSFEEHLRKHKKLNELSQDFIASALCISSQLLYVVCKSYYGKNPKRVVDENMISNAKELLIKKTYNTQEVSDILGFSESSAFSRFFKRYTGISPSLFNK